MHARAHHYIDQSSQSCSQSHTSFFASTHTTLQPQIPHNHLKFQRTNTGNRHHTILLPLEIQNQLTSQQSNIRNCLETSQSCSQSHASFFSTNTTLQPKILHSHLKYQRTHTGNRHNSILHYLDIHNDLT